MPSPFDALIAAADGAVMGVHGESVAAVLTPRLRTQYAARGSDPARPSTTIAGVFTEAPAVDQIRGQAVGEFAGTTRLGSAAPEFWLPASTVAALPYAIAQGDLVTFPGRAGAPVYSVSHIQPTGLGDLNLVLAREDQTT